MSLGGLDEFCILRPLQAAQTAWVAAALIISGCLLTVLSLFFCLLIFNNENEYSCWFGLATASCQAVPYFHNPIKFNGDRKPEKRTQIFSHTHTDRTDNWLSSIDNCGIRLMKVWFLTTSVQCHKAKWPWGITKAKKMKLCFLFIYHCLSLSWFGAWSSLLFAFVPHCLAFEMLFPIPMPMSDKEK